MDGTSNTLMYAERYLLSDGAYVLTAVEHAAGEDSRGLWQINVRPCEIDVHKGDWISDVTYEDMQNGNAVAVESFAIAHEDILLI
jgi:hypothetical protein